MEVKGRGSGYCWNSQTVSICCLNCAICWNVPLGSVWGRGGAHSCPSAVLCSLNTAQSWPSLLPLWVTTISFPLTTPIYLSAYERLLRRAWYRGIGSSISCNEEAVITRAAEQQQQQQVFSFGFFFKCKHLWLLQLNWIWTINWDGNRDHCCQCTFIVNWYI